MMPLKRRAQNVQAWTQSATYTNTVQKWSGRLKNFIIGICLAIIVTGVCYIILSPIIGIVSRAFMSSVDLANPLIFLIPENFTVENIIFAYRHMNYLPTLIMTLSFALLFSVIHVVITSLVGYGFARFKFPGVNILFALCILTIVVPVQTFMVPMFLNFRYFMGRDEWNLIGPATVLGIQMPWSWSFLLLTVTGVGLRSGLYIYIFRQFFRGLPKEIEEAAFIDGAGPFYTYLKVMIPNAVPAIVTVFLFAFVWHYNDTFYSALLITGNRFMATMLSGLAPTFNLAEDVNNPLVTQLVVFSGVLLTIAPVLTIYLFLQRYFIEGLERSGIVG
ncbi:MAG: carbohydrate ABC transporter permease [Firmicutes bacterium]|nr:carbohydrate ABC transporter permease [Bacillota bacterium]